MAAPSFSSFPPVFNSFPDAESSSSSRPQSAHGFESTKPNKGEKHKSSKGKGCEEEKGRIREKRKEQRKDRHDEKHSRGEREHSLKRRIRKQSTSYDEGQHRGSSKASDSEDFNRYYYIDRKGDDLNIRYGTPHVGDVPRYWHVARGKQVLGLGPNLVVVYRGSKGIEIGEAGWFSKAPQLTDSRARSRLLSRGAQRISASSKAALKYKEVDGFIGLPSRKGKEKDQEYRSITSERKGDSYSDSSSEGESGSSGDESDVSPLSAREETLRNLEQRLTEHPASESMWLSLLHHSISDIEPTSRNAERTRAEISLSILERAISAHPANVHSSWLRLKYLRAGEIVWDTARIREEWNKALQDIATADIYVEWLDWIMRTAPDFDSVVEHGIRAVDLVAAGPLNEDADFAKLRIFWRVATFFRQAGYIERGFALFQAQAELSFNLPEEDKHSSFQKRLDALEEFWESEAPRVGDAGSKGWKAWNVNKAAATVPAARPIGKCASQDPYTIWHYNEAQSDARLIFAARMSGREEQDEKGCDDPYAAVLFSDIRPFLVDLQTTKGREMFRLTWLSYLGLHIPGLSSALSSSSFSRDDRWADTYFLHPSFVRSLFPPDSAKCGLITADSQTGVIIGREKTYAKSFDVVKSWSLGVIEPLDGLSVDGEHRMWSQGCLIGVNLEIIDVMRRIFRKLDHGGDSIGWNAAELAFEAAFPLSENASKRSQAMLSENTSSAELLASHAYLERIRRKYQKARKVYRVALQSLAQGNNPSVVCLWWGSAELEWLLLQSDAAIEITLRAAGQPERSGVNILRAKRRLDELCQQGLIPVWRFRLKWIKLRILFELLVGTLDTAIEVSQRLLESEETGQMQHESLTVASVLLVYHHTVTLRNSAPPAILRNLARGALNVYPSNSIIIGVFLECEKGESVWGRVRTLMNENSPGMLQGKSIARRLIEVWIARWEEGRWLNEVERMRAGLEAAVTSDRTRGSPILWKVYVKFEIAARNAKRAKAVLFRALKECPLVKELYLLAFEEDLRHVYTRRELIDLSDTMAERGIRLRNALGEVLEMHGQEDGMESDTSTSVDDDELEHESREMKRLMPYW